MSEEKKILESSPFSGIAVPIAIVLVGALIIFGVTKMLSSGKNHRDLVDEMNSKTFGNRWVAAYELSKFLASSKIPKEDIPWVIENLSKVYKETVDARTRNFVVLALGSLNNPLCIPTLNLGLEDQDPQVQFNAVVSIGNMSDVTGVNWMAVERLLDQDKDLGLKQVALFAMSTHRRPDLEAKALSMLNSSDRNLRYAASLVLVFFKKTEILPVLSEILALGYDTAKPGELNGAQVEALKMNILSNVEKALWKDALKLIEMAEKDSNIRVNTKAKQVLKILKN
jgi:HEAT repeat protein